MFAASWLPRGCLASYPIAGMQDNKIKYSAAQAQAAKAALRSNLLSLAADHSESEGAIPTKQFYNH